MLADDQPSYIGFLLVYNVSRETVNLQHYPNYIPHGIGLVPFLFFFFTMEINKSKMRRHAENLFQKFPKVTVVKLNIFSLWVTGERRGAFLMCPAASLRPSSVGHFVRPHKDATRSCVEEEGECIECLMDIPEGKASTSSQCFCYTVRL